MCGHLPLKSSPCNSHQAFKGIQGLSQVISEIVIQKIFVDGQDILTWYDMHTTVASPVPVANWLHVEEGKITAVRVAFDARELAP